MKKVWVIIAGFACALIIAFFIKANWIPEKYAVKISECRDYEPYILVQEAHHTGTGWVQVGDESGYFLAEAYKDIELTNGDVLPLMDMYDKDYVNTFLCKVEYRGTVNHDAFENEIASYDILEWYPVYPVLRDTILPDWMYPKGFMTKRDLFTFVDNFFPGGEKKPLTMRVEGFDVTYDASGRKITMEEIEDIAWGSSIYEISDKLGEPDTWIGCGFLSPVYFVEKNRAVVFYFTYPGVYEGLELIVLVDEDGESQILKEE